MKWLCALLLCAWLGGPTPPPVPRVVGLSTAQASAVLREKGIEFDVLSSPGHPVGMVFDQFPAPGAPGGGRVSLYTGVAPVARVTATGPRKVQPASPWWGWRQWLVLQLLLGLAFYRLARTRAKDSSKWRPSGRPKSSRPRK